MRWTVPYTDGMGIKRPAIIAVAIAAVIALGGCAAQTGVTAPQTTAATSSAPAAESSPTPTPQPVLTAEPAGVDAQIVEAVHRIPGLENASEADAVGAVNGVCQQLDDGTPPADITFVQNTDAVTNAEAITIATLLVCPAHDPAAQQNAVDQRREAAGQ